ncbi:hypothetical protein E2C01_040364 [Portunus trituberculatus]|uniref:Uncharacterized protein n=1 Tax=Portunus trituberculatus TaxID=210409 RepID=A0A5B7FGB0_PORTR|nr:hypothetical protein [Portunus trituberculatus]
MRREESEGTVQETLNNAALFCPVIYNYLSHIYSVTNHTETSFHVPQPPLDIALARDMLWLIAAITLAVGFPSCIKENEEKHLEYHTIIAVVSENTPHDTLEHCNTWSTGASQPPQCDFVPKLTNQM